MSIERVIVKNYRVLRSVNVRLDPELNIIVGFAIAFEIRIVEPSRSHGPSIEGSAAMHSVRLAPN